MSRQDGCTCGRLGAPDDGSHHPGCPVVPIDMPRITAGPRLTADQAAALRDLADAARRWHRLAHRGPFDDCHHPTCYHGHPDVIR